ncbi:hypothetical protein RASY3_01750 [Ruminococcus albus SY3]|uniref:ABC-2 transporter permease n=2 Tax=Ruminococcus albus TaxID=1264 RepID=A0A011UK12_RUMAL|nr:hypothetical protein RASY3_01750 [Ruminococcus albus SY3]
MCDMTGNKIKGLLLNEWYTIGKIFIAVCVMVIASLFGSLFMAAATGEAVIGFSTVTGGIGVMLLSSAFSYDNWKSIGSFKKSMPYSDSEVVLVRFLPPVMLIAVEAFCTPILLTIGGLIHGDLSEGFEGQAAFVTAVSVLYTAIPVMIFYPLFFKYGYQKMQMILGIFSAILVTSSLSLSMMGIVRSPDDENMADKSMLINMPVPVCVIIIAVVAALIVVAYKVSVAGYSKRDD